MSFANNSPEREEGIDNTFHFLLRKWFLKSITNTPHILELRPYKDFKPPRTNFTTSRQGQENEEALTPRSPAINKQMHPILIKTAARK